MDKEQIAHDLTMLLLKHEIDAGRIKFEYLTGETRNNVADFVEEYNAIFELVSGEKIK